MAALGPDAVRHMLGGASSSGNPGTQAITFISSSVSMAPLDSRKAALARFREKKAKSHFAPKVRYHERKKLAEARPRYKGQFVKMEQLPQELRAQIMQQSSARAAASTSQPPASDRKDVAKGQQ
jgi:hypothetical protein